MERAGQQGQEVAARCRAAAQTLGLGGRDVGRSRWDVDASRAQTFPNQASLPSGWRAKGIVPDMAPYDAEASSLDVC